MRFWLFVNKIAEKVQKTALKRIYSQKNSINPYTNKYHLWYNLVENTVDERGSSTMNALEVARYVISRANEQGCPVSNLKLQKILYFLWIEFFSSTETHLYNDDICAWPLGPVIPDVYYEFCSYGGNPITKSYPNTLPDAVSEKLNGVIDKLLAKSASSLVNETHQRGSPWDTVFKGGTGNRRPIPFDLIKSKEC